MAAAALATPVAFTAAAAAMAAATAATSTPVAIAAASASALPAVMRRQSGRRLRRSTPPGYHPCAIDNPWCFPRCDLSPQSNRALAHRRHVLGHGSESCEQKHPKQLMADTFNKIQMHGWNSTSPVKNLKPECSSAKSSHMDGCGDGSSNNSNKRSSSSSSSGSITSSVVVLVV